MVDAQLARDAAQCGANAYNADCGVGQTVALHLVCIEESPGSIGQGAR